MIRISSGIQWLRLALSDGSNGAGTCFPLIRYDRNRTSFQNIFWNNPWVSFKNHAPFTPGDRRKSSFQNVFSERNLDDEQVQNDNYVNLF